MKKIITVLVWILVWGASVHAFAQTNIDEMEYFFDSDPGFGNGIAIAISTGPSHNVDLNINTSGLTAGFHTLVIRAKHQSGSWGVGEYKVVYVASESVAATNNIDEMEYYFDTDPGQGNGTPITVPTAPSLNISPLLATSSLAAGFHVLHLRTRDVNGNWSVPEIRPFYVAPGNANTQANIVQLEYFFDTEPGYGAGTPLTVTAGAQINLQSLISSAALTPGFHTISIRARDNDNQWSIASMRTFFVDEFTQISAIEYYIDSDPGEGSATNITVPPGGSIEVDVTIPTGSFTGGSHTIGVRAARTDGSWGNTSTTSFTIRDTQTITFPLVPSATFGDAPFPLTGTSSSGLTLTYDSSDPSVATISGNMVTIVGAGTTTITASQPGNPAFAPASDVTRTLVVDKADQTITFGALAPRATGDAPFELTATSNSSLTISYSSSNTSVATVSGNMVTVVGVGTTNITASQTGDDNYNLAPDVVQELVVLATNDAPTLSGSSGTAFFISDPVVINNTLIVTDTEDILESATVSITTGLQIAEDQLLFTPAGSLNGDYNATTGVLTISGAASAADYQSTLRSVAYNNTSPTPNTEDRSISIQVNDGSNVSPTVVVTISINKPPAIAAPPRDIEAGGNFVFFIEDIISDPDDNLDLSTLSILSAQGATITISGNVITVNYSALKEFQGTDELTISVCDVGGKCQTQQVAVEVNANVEVFNGVSANNDSMNDFFKLRFLPPLSRVIIVNRWGDIVYENDDYDSNDAAKRFEGNNTDGKELNPGTYFYKIELPDGRIRTGYLQLKR